ncbi:MAG TPA: DUF402 domain-containing protein, partial [Candidatus Thermoplasmatota archaeon]|nr:DUF402 domain-containing protein [Candidatus Thermoplasmatota archaeon]
MRRFRVGEHVAWRSVERETGTVMTVWPAVVVRDDDQAIVTFTPTGSIGKRRTGERSGGPRARQLMRWDGGHEDRPWIGTNVVHVHPPGEAFSLWCAWDAEWRPAWWYVNLEEPWRRTAIGFDSRDLWLDLARGPDETAWRWKDEDELAWAVEEGRCTPELAARIRAEGERAIGMITGGEPPFDRDWSAWRPDPAWSVP